MSAPTTFLIAGGTGRQGGAVVNALLADKASSIEPQDIYVLTRNTEGGAAAALTARGVKLVQGELGEPDAIFKQLASKDVNFSKTAVFLAQAHGPTELSDAKGFIDAAISNRLAYFVYSSVDRGGKVLSDRDASYCKTFSDKYEIEKHLEAVSGGGKRINYTILRPTWFADNAIWEFPGKLCMAGWRENLKGKKMQVVVTKDIGRWAVEGLLRPDASGIRNTAISIASDYLSFKEIDDIFREETGAPVGVIYGWFARLMIFLIKDLRTMFAWINERDYGADLEELSKTVKPTTFREWVKEATKA
ncbi:NAD(P)-binding protein [Lipomyces kononenkoae]